MKLNHKNRLIVFIFGLVCALLSIGYSSYVAKQQVYTQKEKAYEISRAYAGELKRDFNYGITRAESMRDVVIENNGRVSHRDFDRTSRLLMRDYIKLNELAPKGVVTQTYPHRQGSQTVNLMANQEAAQVLTYVKDKNEAVLYGPIVLPKVKKSVSIMVPVTLKNGKFWGYVIIALKLPDVYQHTLKSLRAMGYDYCLDTNKSPLTKNRTQVESSKGIGNKVKNSVGYSFSIGSLSWTLNIVPRGGWATDKGFFTLLGCLITSVFLVFMLSMYLRTRQQKEALDRLANVDALTGLYNRRGFMKEAGGHFKDTPEQPVTLAFLDLDDFKLVNDVYGHNVGDLALEHLSQHLKQVFPGESVIGRTGGDEFCVAIPEEPEMAHRLVASAIVGVQEFDAGEQKVRYTISAGYADYPSQAQSPDQLIILADMALYAAKMHGKHVAKQYEPQMQLIKRGQLGFNMKNVSQGMPGGLLIYRADYDQADSQEILLANDYLIHLFACQSLEEFLTYTKSSFKGLVYPEDYEKVVTNREKQIKALSGNIDDDVLFLDYRILTKDGRVKPISTVGRYVQDDYYGNVFCVFILPDGLITDPEADEK
ncbi:diguanylate cyclase domain-containing protein [Lactobacillus sp.]|uniref:sensor domain-containing diguanylate cyclase n=1 Tax=Lactobacillus sp. TaxID=1591 RepID=UPI003EF0E9CD